MVQWWKRPSSHAIFNSRGYVINEKTYICTSNTYDHQTCQGGGIGWGPHNYQTTRPFTHVIRWQMENFISTLWQNSRPQNIAVWKRRVRKAYLTRNVTFWPRGTKVTIITIAAFTTTILIVNTCHFYNFQCSFSNNPAGNPVENKCV